MDTATETAGVRKVRDAVNPDSTLVYLVPLGGGQIAEVRVSSAVASPAFDVEMRALSERWQDTPPTAYRDGAWRWCGAKHDDACCGRPGIQEGA